MKHHIPRPTSYLAAALLSALPGYALADFIPLGDLPGGAFGSNALGVSANGATVVGSSSATFQPVVDEAYRWTEATGMVDLGTTPARPSEARRRAQGMTGRQNLARVPVS